MNTQGIELKLTKEKYIDIFHGALCNGLSYLRGYDIELDYSKIEYQSAKKKLNKPCYEEILIQILKDGGTLNFIDYELDQITTVDLDMVVNNLPKTPMNYIIDMINEQDDAVTADAILQTVLFGEIIFG